MKKILVTGGTVFVSKFVAQYLVNKGYEVYVLNRGTKEQVVGVHLIQADRNCLTNELKDYYFDVVIDVAAYNKKDIKNLRQALNNYGTYVFISSSAVYPEINSLPFHEEQEIGNNRIWREYGKNKVEAEQYLLQEDPTAYIVRPPYLYGPMQNVYREGFVFDCARENREFYIPKDGKMKLQFFYIEDLAKLLEQIFIQQPKDHIFNVGNTELVDINTFVEICYEIVGTPLNKRYVSNHQNQRDYFCFHEYEYWLDVNRQNELLSGQKDLLQGLAESYKWYLIHENEVNKKEYLSFIDANF